VGGEGVAQGMAGGVLADAGFAHGALERLAKGGAAS
jgi:hypothetical protein